MYAEVHRAKPIFVFSLNIIMAINLADFNILFTI